MSRRVLPVAFGAALAMFHPSIGWGQSPDSSVQVFLDPIFITGELIDRPIEDSATSAEIFNEQDLEEKPGLDGVRDVLEQTPNVSVLTGTINAPTIRGVDGTGPAIGGNAFFAGTRSRINWQIDGRSANYNEIIFNDFNIWDVDRVEVLRGPQSTLTGRNSIAGSVVIETKDPTFNPEFAAQAAGGNLDQRRFSTMVNTPVIDGLMAVRLTADWVSSRSSVTYVPFPGVNDPAEKEALNVRGKMLLTPDIGTDTKLLLSLVHNDNKTPQGEIVRRPFETRFTDFPNQPVHTNITDTLGVEFSTSLSETVTFETNANFTDFEYVREATAQGGPATIDTRELTIEPKLLYKNSAGYSAVAGIYYYQARSDEYLLFAFDNFFVDKTDTMAAYAEGIIPLNSKLDLTVGGRYEHERRRRVGGDLGTFVDIDLDETYEAFMPKAGLNWHPTETKSFGVQVSRGYNGGGGGVSFSFPFPFPVFPYEYDQETVWNYEVYGRQTFANGKIRTTQNIFYSDYSDMQLQFDVTPANLGDGAFIVRNFDKVRTYGAELGMTAVVSDSLTLYGGLGLLWTDIVDSSGAGLDGNELPTAPNVTASLGAIWKRGNWRVSASGRFSGSYFSDIENRPQFKIDPFIVADAEVAYDVGGVEIFGSVKNVFDNEEPIARSAPTTLTAPADRAVLLQPRTVLVGVKKRY